MRGTLMDYRFGGNDQPMRFAILPCLLVLAACGQTGPLYHPGSKPPPGHGSVLPAATRPAAPSAPSAPAPAAAPGTPAAPASDPVKPDEDKVKDKDDASPGAPAATTPAPEPAQP
ncbi:MAG: LPS translocon maturation chaperone LptM [Panacagrimonas sp.]